MLNKDMDKCTGCGACIQICPKQCITWSEKEFGFKYPSIDEEKCIGCGLCEQVCQINKSIVQPENQKAYAAVYKDEKILFESTSGGAFSAIAYYALEKGGCVFGCTMDINMQVKHICITKSKELYKLRGSKYVQSDIGSTYSQAESILKRGTLVLFVGTPCQIAGLKNYLRRDYENLITVDLVCHGIGSQAYFNKYIEYVKKRYGLIKKLNFRSKKYGGWSCSGDIVYSKNNKYFQKPYYEYNNYYYYYFLHGDIYRKSCYSCFYANVMRQGDFTLGDFWGIEAYNIPMKTENGCSLILVNTNNANKILNELDNIELYQVDIENAVRGNAQLEHPSAESNIRSQLATQFETSNAEVLYKYFLQKNIFSIIKGKVRSVIPYRLKLSLRKKIYKRY